MKQGINSETLQVDENELEINLCRKCRIKPSVVSARNNQYCQECFLQGTEHRFRTHFLKIKAPENPQVLLALSGGESSSCLIELFTPFSKCSSNPKKPLQYPSVLVCHIDQSCIYGDKVAGLEDKLRRLASSYELPFVSVKMEDVLYRDSNYSFYNFEKDRFESMKADESMSKSKLLRDNILNLKSASDQEDLFHILTVRALLLAARLHKCNNIMLGNNATQLAIRAISLTSHGRGVNMSNNLDLVSHVSIDELEPIFMIRPLRDTLLSEICLFNQLKSIESCSDVTFSGSSTSIEQLTKKFIMELQTEMPSTVSIITKTAFKIQPNANVLVSKSVCKLCCGFVDIETTPGEPVLKSHLICYACKNLFILCKTLPYLGN